MFGEHCTVFIPLSLLRHQLSGGQNNLVKVAQISFHFLYCDINYLKSKTIWIGCTVFIPISLLRHQLSEGQNNLVKVA